MELYDETPPDLPDVSKIGTLGWLAIGSFVTGFDLMAKETLSAACQRGIDNDRTRPFVLAAIALTGSHLAGIIPDHYDPFKRGLEALSHLVRRTSSPE